jgi:hypothetical protein
MALVVVGLGCQHHNSAVNTKAPPDPLLISKKPVEGKPTSYSPSTAWRDPQPPAVPPRDAVVEKSGPSQPVPVGYRQDAGVSIGKPRWLPDGQ